MQSLHLRTTNGLSVYINPLLYAAMVPVDEKNPFHHNIMLTTGVVIGPFNAQEVHQAINLCIDQSGEGDGPSKPALKDC